MPIAIMHSYASMLNVKMAQKENPDNTRARQVINGREKRVQLARIKINFIGGENYEEVNN